jgi:hypothetical protein
MPQNARGANDQLRARERQKSRAASITTAMTPVIASAGNGVMAKMTPIARPIKTVRAILAEKVSVVEAAKPATKQPSEMPPAARFTDQFGSGTGLPSTKASEIAICRTSCEHAIAAIPNSGLSQRWLRA